MQPPIMFWSMFLDNKNFINAIILCYNLQIIHRLWIVTLLQMNNKLNEPTIC